jgi:hypothetical protein
MRYTLEQKLRALNQEIAYREKVYPKLERLGKQTRETSAHKTEVMRQIAADYRARLAAELSLQEQLPMLK